MHFQTHILIYQQKMEPYPSKQFSTTAQPIIDHWLVTKDIQEIPLNFNNHPHPHYLKRDSSDCTTQRRKNPQSKSTQVTLKIHKQQSKRNNPQGKKVRIQSYQMA